MVIPFYGSLISGKTLVKVFPQGTLKQDSTAELYKKRHIFILFPYAHCCHSLFSLL